MKERSLKSVQSAQTTTVPPAINGVYCANDTFTIVQGPRSKFGGGGGGGRRG